MKQPGQRSPAPSPRRRRRACRSVDDDAPVPARTSSPAVGTVEQRASPAGVSRSPRRASPARSPRRPSHPAQQSRSADHRPDQHGRHGHLRGAEHDARLLDRRRCRRDAVRHDAPASWLPDPVWATSSRSSAGTTRRRVHLLARHRDRGEHEHDLDRLVPSRTARHADRRADQLDRRRPSDECAPCVDRRDADLLVHINLHQPGLQHLDRVETA